MPPRFDPSPSSWSSELTADAPSQAPGKRSLTQRVQRAGAPSPSIVSRPPGVPVQRALDPAAAAVQRAQQERDAAAAMGFLGGPADSIDSSLVQLQIDAHTGLTDEAIGAHAAAGVGGAGQALPHLDTIQRAFGPHDVSGVRAHVGGAAAEASGAIGAHAYATGNDVAFASQPDLFLAAHEAAHVVQQRQGVALKGAVGQAGDAYEQHADEVAAAVVRGDSAAELLGAPGTAAGTGLQRFPVDVPRADGTTITVASSPSTIATTDGNAAGSNYRQTNQYNNDRTAWLTIPDDYTGFVSLDWFGSADLNDGTFYDTSAPLSVNAVYDVAYKNGVFSQTLQRFDHDSLPSCGVTFEPKADFNVEPDVSPTLSLQLSFVPSGGSKKTDTDQYTAKGTGGTDLSIAGKGVKGGGELTYSKTRGEEITQGPPGPVQKTYLLKLAFTTRRKSSPPEPARSPPAKAPGGDTNLQIGPFVWQDNRQDNSTNDNSTNDHSKDDHSKNDHSKNDHSKNDHSKHDHSKNDHSKQTIVLPPPLGGGDKERAPTIPGDLQNHRVYFAYGSSSMNKKSEHTGTTPEAQVLEYMRLIDAYEEAYAAAGRDFENPWTLLKQKVFSVKFIGKASSDGGDVSNARLSRRRAEAFERAFLDKNFNDPDDKSDRGYTRGDGESGAVQDHDSPADRYVKIFWAAG